MACPLFHPKSKAVSKKGGTKLIKHIVIVSTIVVACGSALSAQVVLPPPSYSVGLQSGAPTSGASYTAPGSYSYGATSVSLSAFPHLTESVNAGSAPRHNAGRRGCLLLLLRSRYGAWRDREFVGF